MPNFNSIRLELVGVGDNPISGDVSVQLRNHRVASFNQRFDFVNRKVVNLKKVVAAPEGGYEMTLLPDRYHLKILAINVPAGEDPLVVRQTFLLHPDKAKPTFPKITELPTTLRSLLKSSGMDAADWNSRDPLQKAGLLNIFSKANTIALSTGDFVPAFFRKLNDLKPARIFVLVDPALHTQVGQSTDFHRVDGALHTFPGGFQMFDSFKSQGDTATLQLTFARHPTESLMLVDADLDDHSGIKHAFDVIQHHLTGTDTHPYNMHQVLKEFWGIDPGYELE